MSIEEIALIREALEREMVCSASLGDTRISDKCFTLSEYLYDFEYTNTDTSIKKDEITVEDIIDAVCKVTEDDKYFMIEIIDYEVDHDEKYVFVIYDLMECGEPIWRNCRLSWRASKEVYRLLYE